MVEWKRVKGGKYAIELAGWNFVVERMDSLRDSGDSRYKFQLYESIDRPQSASSLEVEVNNSSLGDYLGDITFNHNGALAHIVAYIDKTNALNFPGIPEPLKCNINRIFNFVHELYNKK